MGKWQDTLALFEIPKDMGNAEAPSCHVLSLHREGFLGARANYFQSKEPSREPEHEQHPVSGGLPAWAGLKTASQRPGKQKALLLGLSGRHHFFYHHLGVSWELD